ncbi:hypothetical protein CI109_102478 [Kwoniella shandongensis]|uniref:Uncharacterized protein n=1 Tax=Kwoniella shandongensis TaxID=1734106 RepID=A0A5M6C491_9TREE|nr:uncharacterized protein CI109_003203 [Kwoniella shandongensis]KAA5528305.1 hypothetical protein CI109_003203 [Kwoniella shandongensis]
MTVVPAGAQLAPVDLPPPPPAADPREPPPNITRRSGGTLTPQRPRSPAHIPSRDTSPVRATSTLHRSSSSDALSPPLFHPSPRPAASPASSVPIHHHLSRPSSPSSIHSSGSAIFERDIELLPVASLSLNPNTTPSHSLNHKASRLSHLSHGSALDHTVPAVLDDAVEALTAGDGLSRGFEGLEIEAPAQGAVGMARQSSSSLPSMTGARKVSTGPGALSTSRSPSPISVTSRGSSATSPAQSPPILSQLSAQQSLHSIDTNTASRSGPLSGGADSSKLSPTTSVPRPAMPQRTSTGPQLPGGWAFGGGASAPAAEKAPSPIEESPSAAPTPAAVAAATASPATSPTPPNAVPSHLTPTKSKAHRLSFISYNDLLLSVPTQVTNLGEITSGNLSPDHLPGTVSPSMNTRSPVISQPGFMNSLPPPVLGSGGSAGSPVGPPLEAKQSWESGSGGRVGGLGLGDGEWGREGLGKGLEQRLEEVAQTQQ